MADYLSGPDYQSYQVTPYQLPAQQIVQAIGARQSYWEQGAERLRDSYQNVLGLDLSLKANRDKLDNLMQGVNQNLKKVVATDLSIGDNVTSALKIFDPITNDQDLKYDNAITKHYQTQNQIAEGYKTTGDGSGYNQTNVAYLNRNYNKWVEANDPSKSASVYNSKETYTPYYDAASETTKILKDFKPDATSVVGGAYTNLDSEGRTTKDSKPIDGYLMSVTNKSAYASQLRAYLDAHLSDKAKNQLRINGVMAYGDNISRLGDDLIEHNNNIILSTNKSIDELKGKLAATKDPSIKQYLTDEINLRNSNVAELKASNAKLGIKDYSELNKVKDQVAGQLYTNEWTDNMSRASQHKDVLVKMSVDQWRLERYKQFEEDQRAALNRQNQLDKVTLKWTLDNKKDKEPIATSPGTLPSDESNDINIGQKAIDGYHLKSVEIKTSVSDALQSRLKNDIEGYDKMNKTQALAAFDEWSNQEINKQWLRDNYYHKIDEADGLQSAYNSMTNSVENELKEKHPEDYNRLKMIANGVNQDLNKEIFDHTTNSYIPLSKEDIKSLILHNNPNISYTKESRVVGDRFKSTVDGYAININGKKYSVPGGKLTQLLTDADQGMEKLNQTRIEIANKALNKSEGYETFDDPEDKRLNPAKGRVISVLSTVKNAAVGEMKPGNVTLIGKNMKGDLYFNLTGQKQDGEKFNLDGLKDEINAGKNSGLKYSKARGMFYISHDALGNSIQAQSFQDPRLEPIQTDILFRAKDKGSDVLTSTNMNIGGKNFAFVVTTQDGQPLNYEVKDMDLGKIIPNSSSNNLSTAAANATMYAEQLERIKQQLKSNNQQ